MKKSVSGLDVVTAVVHASDYILNIVIMLCLLLALLYGGFGLWDTWNIYKGASSNGDLLKYKPVQTDGGTSDLTLLDLQEINPDVCAWLTIDDTNIDYPVVQGEDNFEYLNKSAIGEFSLSGSIFLDSRNDADFSDYYSLVYGHHMAGNAMFGELPNFLEKSFFEKHTEGSLYLTDATFKIEWFACMYTDAYDEKVFVPTDAESEQLRSSLLTYLRENSTQYRDIGLSVSDQIIGLSTCSEATTNGRVLLFGRLSRNVYETE